jgi:hypothetical protein
MINGVSSTEAEAVSFRAKDSEAPDERWPGHAGERAMGRALHAKRTVVKAGLHTGEKLGIVTTYPRSEAREPA